MIEFSPSTIVVEYPYSFGERSCSGKECHRSVKGTAAARLRRKECSHVLTWPLSHRVVGCIPGQKHATRRMRRAGVDAGWTSPGVAEIGTKFLIVRDSTLRFVVGDRKKLSVPSIPGGGTGRATAAGVNKMMAGEVWGGQVAERKQERPGYRRPPSPVYVAMPIPIETPLRRASIAGGRIGERRVKLQSPGGNYRYRIVFRRTEGRHFELLPVNHLQTFFWGGAGERQSGSARDTCSVGETCPRTVVPRVLQLQPFYETAALPLS